MGYNIKRGYALPRKMFDVLALEMVHYGTLNSRG